MNITAIIILVFAIGVAVFAFFIPTIVKRFQKRDAERFYDSLNIGDVFIDPYYANDPFSAQYRVIEIIAKKNNYILYEIKWMDSTTRSECSNYTPRKESRSVEMFLHLVQDFYKQQN